jgi:hypothetical protein
MQPQQHGIDKISKHNQTGIYLGGGWGSRKFYRQEKNIRTIGGN